MSDALDKIMDAMDKGSGDYVYLPARAIRVASAEFRRRSLGAGLDFGIPGMDRALVPIVGGDLITLLGRPGMGKTAFLLYLAKRHAGQLRERHVKSGSEGSAPYVLYATWETLVEEFVGMFTAAGSGYSLEDIGRGKADMQKVDDAMVAVLSENVAVFGQSLESKGQRLPTPNLFNLRAGVEHLHTSGLEVGAVYVDYVQRIPGNRHDRSEAVSENLERIKDLAVGFGLPFLAAVQARREVDDQSGLKFPGMKDGQWSSNIEQTSDKVLSLTIPSNYMEAGTPFDLGGGHFEASPGMLAVKLLKQRFGPMGADNGWVFGFDFGKVEVVDRDFEAVF